jgi:hypothetical protein
LANGRLSHVTSVSPVILMKQCATSVRPAPVMGFAVHLSFPLI